jgi:hypothetical protein
MTAIFGCPLGVAAGEHMILVEEHAAAFATVLRTTGKRSGSFGCPCCAGRCYGTPETFDCDTCDVGRRA